MRDATTAPQPDFIFGKWAQRPRYVRVGVPHATCSYSTASGWASAAEIRPLEHARFEPKHAPAIAILWPPCPNFGPLFVVPLIALQRRVNGRRWPSNIRRKGTNMAQGERDTQIRHAGTRDIALELDIILSRGFSNGGMKETKS